MSVRRTTARFSLTAAVIAGLVFAGAVAPATAAEEGIGLYSATDPDTGADAFVSLSTTDATATQIGASHEGLWIVSVEYADGIGYALTGVGDEYIASISTWDVSTGMLLSTVPLSVSDDNFDSVRDAYALDVRTDGVLLTIVVLDDDTDWGERWVASIDPATGEVTPLVELPAGDVTPYYEGLATNPVDGVTYVFFDYDEGMPYMVVVDFTTSSLGAETELQGIQDSLGSGWISEGDFDATGTLWFTYSGGVSRTDGDLDIATEATRLGDPDITSKAIAVGPPYAPPAPQLADTGLEVAPLLAGAAALLTLGGALLIARRRAHA